MEPAATSSDLQLMRSVAAGEVRAFRTLANTHLQPILTYVTRLLRDPAEAEEIAQETMLRAWQRAAEYEPKARLTTWLHRIAHNLAIDALRRRRGQTSELAEELPAPDSQRPSRVFERHAEALRVQSALEQLPERQQHALLLCHEQGLTNPEIAEVLGVGVSAVESLLARGRRTLRERLTPTQQIDV